MKATVAFGYEPQPDCPHCIAAHDISKSLGEQVQNARKHVGITSRELARRTGVTPSYMNDIEWDRRVPSAETFAAIRAVIPIDGDARNRERADHLARVDLELYDYIRRQGMAR